MKQRAERLALQMQREISDIVRTGVKDPRVGFITLTGVELSNDYAHAKVFVSVLGDASLRQETMAALERARGFIRGELGRRVRLRVTPELHFKLDATIDYSERIGRVLHELSAERPEESAAGSGEDGNHGTDRL